MIKGIDITRYGKVQTGETPLHEPIYEERAEIIHNVLIGEPSTEDVATELQLNGHHLAYVLALPKGDTHDWTNVHVSFFGQDFRTYGAVTQGIEAMVPLCWNKKVKVERYG